MCIISYNIAFQFVKLSFQILFYYIINSSFIDYQVIKIITD